MSAAKVSVKEKGGAKASISFAKLQLWNKWLAVVFALQAVVILIVSDSRTFPVSVNFLGTDSLQSQAQGHTVLAAGTQHWFDVNLTLVVVAFLLMATIGHWLAAVQLRKTFERDARQSVNKIRWIEYAFSASTMAVAVGLIVGVQDFSTLLMLFGFTAVANLFGLVLETRDAGAKNLRWLSYAIAAITGFVPWIVIASYVIGAVVYGTASQAYVWWTVGAMFVLFAAFVVNAYRQHRGIGKWADYLYGEQRFMFLSLVAKSALAWLLFAGILHP